MDIHLPEPIATYFAAQDARDFARFERCFDAEAVVRDEGRAIKGVAAIKAWQMEAAAKYNHIAEPVGLIERDGKTVVTAKVTGNFPGSPVGLDHIFELRGDKIVALEIH